MAAFISFHGFVPGASSERSSAAYSARTARRLANLTEIAARTRTAAGETAAFLWTGLALSFSLSVMVGFFL